jgi:orotidine-5'-phosphate decarboxylase
MLVDKLLVALDVESGTRAMELARSLHGIVGGVKIGSRLFTLEGPALVHALTSAGTRVFLDLKFHDIPNTVAQAVDAAVQTGAWMIDVHCSGGSAMMQAAVRAARDAAARAGRTPPVLVGITVLTSMDEAALRETGVDRPLASQVIHLAQMAKMAGLDGVVCSPHEIAVIRDACGRDFVIVTPGIRGAAAGTEKNDQTRTMGAGEAVRAGASYLVIGRPITASENPRAAAERIGEEVG